MPTTHTRRPAALLTVLAAGGLLFASAPPSRAAAPAPAPTPVRARALPTPPGSAPVVCKIGTALLEECDARLDLRTETVRDEITTARAATAKPGPVRG